jgi:hypothetical protein
MADPDGSFLSRWSRRKAEARDGRLDEAADAPPATGSPGVDAAPAAGTTPVAGPGSRPVMPTVAPSLAPSVSATPGSLAEPAMPTAAAAQPLEPAPAPRAAAADAPPPPSLADVGALTRDSDYSRFVASDVAPDVKNAALKKLFSDPHFNVMDGLDTYIDDYGKPDPLPPGMLRKMVQSQLLGLFAGEPAQPEAGASAHAPHEARPEASVDAAIDASAGDADPLAPCPSAATAPEEAPAHEDADLQLQPDDAAGRPGDRAGDRADPGRER